MVYRRVRGTGVRALVTAGLAIGTITIAVLGFAPRPTESSAAAAEALPQATPREMAALLGTVGLDPETLAAAGVSSAQCGVIFDAATVYCLQANRPLQFELAHKALNQAKARAVKRSTAPVSANGVSAPPPPTVAQAQGTLEDLKANMFQFVTSGLSSAQVAKLNTIRANKQWGLPAAYLVVNRSNAEWTRLRGALAAKRWATKKGTPLAAESAQLIATADADSAVSAAKSAVATGLTGVKHTWTARAANQTAP